MLIYFNTDTHYANSLGNPLYQAMVKKDEKNKAKETLFWLSFCSLFGAWKIFQSFKHRTKNSTKTRCLFFFLFFTVYLLFKCHFVAW